MNRATIRTTAFIASRQPWAPMCCCMQPRIRFRSSLSAAATNSVIDWDHYPAPSYSTQLLGTQPPPQPASPDALQAATVNSTPPTLVPTVTPEEVKPKKVRGRPRMSEEAREKRKTERRMTYGQSAKATAVALELSRAVSIQASASSSSEKTMKGEASSEDSKKVEIKARRRRSSGQQRKEVATRIPRTRSSSVDAPVFGSLTKPVGQEPVTSQGYASSDEFTSFPELSPAPFPRDIHSGMSHINRDVLRRSDSIGTPGPGLHNDLKSFEGLDHNTESTIYRGTRFEYQTQNILKTYLGIYTQRSAGNNDLGVDLRGTWFLPLSASPKPGDLVRHLKVIVQCKGMRSKIGPKYVRELQGSLSYETQPTMAILAVSSEFTKQALVPYSQSLWPMALVVIDTERYECKSLMWNQAAEKVMHGVQVGTCLFQGKHGVMDSRPVLCFDNKVVERLPGPYLNES